MTAVASVPPTASGDALTLRDVGKRFGETVALEDINLTLPAGQLSCFLGPSGCGKTTLLRLIAGLETPTSGELRLGSDDLTHVPAHERNVGMVFQSFALFPHLTVAENVAYGPRIRGVAKRVRTARAAELLDLVQLTGLGERRVTQLSGGQRQRVAMARALALHPTLFLLDEPLSALDAQLRGAMQLELRGLQQRLGITTIIVTHDQEEAMTMADTIVVLGQGRVQQQGTPLEIYHHPVNRFVADFIGRNNFLAAESVPGGVRILGSFFPVVASPDALPGTALTLAVRPEKLKVSATPPLGDALPGRVSFVRDLGQRVETYIELEGKGAGAEQLVSVGDTSFAVGTPVWVGFAADAGTVLTS